MTQLRDIQLQLEFQIHLNLGITTYIILGGQSFSARKLLEVENICVDFRILLSVCSATFMKEDLTQVSESKRLENQKTTHDSSNSRGCHRRFFLFSDLGELWRGTLSLNGGGPIVGGG